uniref:Uncharacterized protein n=1 Tax=Setaria digitata TaxID=48799 RepID=A0A915PT27_9BILA
MMLSTAFCLLNLPNHYRKRANNVNGAECWLESDGNGMHCICSENFCNQLRDRRIPSQGNMPLKNALMIKNNPLIDYDYNIDNDADFTFDLTNLDDHVNAVAGDSFDDLIPIGIDKSDYQDELESSLHVSPMPTLPLSLSSSSSPSLSVTEFQNDNYTTARSSLPNQNNHFYVTNENIKTEQIIEIITMNPDEMLKELKRNITLSKGATNNNCMMICSIYFILASFFKLSS